jgi:hypothetical protein
VTPVRLRDLRSEIDWFRFLRLFDAGGLILDETRMLRQLLSTSMAKVTYTLSDHRLTMALLFILAFIAL